MDVSKIFYSLILIVFVGPTTLYAQQEVVSNNLYVSDTDDLLTIKKISILPALDNIGGIYSRPLEKHISEFIDHNHHWDLVEPSTIGPLYAPTDLVDDPQKIMNLNIPSDAVVSSQVIKGPGGINIKMALFLTRDGKLFAEDEVKNFKQFDVDKVNEQAEILLHRILKKIP